VCVGGGRGGEEREGERERERESFVVLRATPHANTHCSEVTETGRPEANHECGMCMEDIPYIIPKSWAVFGDDV
jgi:hypothetical protein